jgi:ComF family protein
MLKALRGFPGEVFRVFVPALCAVCDGVLSAGERWLCRECAMGLAAGFDLGERRAGENGGTVRVIYPLVYAPPVARLIKDMKYSDRPGLSRVLAPYVAMALTSMEFARPLLVPVPLHAAKLRERGYNQSRLLSEEVGRLTGVEVAPGALVRRRNTRSQAGLDGDHRHDNVRGAFAVPCGAAPAGRHVILVDDVMTTGATLGECARALKGAGITEVTGCVIASSA